MNKSFQSFWNWDYSFLKSYEVLEIDNLGYDEMPKSLGRPNF